MLSAALDSAGNHAEFALLEDGEVMLEALRPMRGREAAALPEFVLSELAKVGVKLEAIQRWSVGAGPGSFTGIRLVAALVAGWCFGREGVSGRCVPGAVSLAAALSPAPGERIGALYDGRNREFIYYGLAADAQGFPVPSGECEVLTAEAAREFFRNRAAERLAVAAAEADAVAALLPPGSSFCPVSEISAVPLARDPHFAFDGDFTKLVYIRPAVFPPPAK